MDEKVCLIKGCKGKVVRIDNLFLHTLGSEPKSKPDFSRFVECGVWRCAECGYVQLYSDGKIIEVP